MAKGKKRRRTPRQKPRDKWFARYERLKSLIEKGRPSTYRKIDDPELVRWIDEQRANRADGRLGEKKTELLKAIRFPWKPSDPKRKSASRRTRRKKARRGPSLEERWEKKAKQLDTIFMGLPPALKEEESWSQNYSGWDGLQTWLHQQRNRNAKGKLEPKRIERVEPKRIERLNRINFDWRRLSRSDISWERRFLELLELEAKNPHPRFWDTPETQELARWVWRESLSFRKGEVHPERARRLAALGVDLNGPPVAEHASSDVLFQRLLTYKEEYGDVDVPRNYRKDRLLGQWVGRIRNRKKKERLAPVFIRRLEEVGFKWKAENVIPQAWYDSYRKLLAFYRQHGHVHVPRENRRLSAWLIQQRVFLRAGKLNRKKVALLEKVPIEEGVNKSRTGAWKERYEEIKTIMGERGWSRLPTGAQIGTKLTKWLTNQRIGRRSGKLATERVRLLDEIGMNWNPEKGVKRDWQESYKRLCAFRKKYGHARVTRSHPDKGLASYVDRQRLFYRKGKLHRERVRLLEKIGFQWSVADQVRPEWMAHYRRLKDYYSEHGHSCLPRIHPPDQPLAEFVWQQKRRYRKGKLLDEHIWLLKEVAFAFPEVHE